MIDFVGIYNEKVKTIGDKIAFTDGSVSVSYSQLDTDSAKICAYLQSKGIGKEDFVQILLPRGVLIPVAVIGVVKAGAAFVVLEDTYPSDRIEFIYKDCGCKLRIDEELYKEIVSKDDVARGFVDADPHDACYAVYTSGSTGNPKGVLHEYGNIEQNYKSFETWYDASIDNAAIFAPFYFVAGVIDIFHYITRGRTTYIIPHDMTRDFVAVKKFIIDNNIEEIFLPPSYLRIYTEPADTLKVIYTGSESANGLTYNDKPTLINFYAMSESGFVVLQSNLKRAYDIAPVGRALLDEIKLCLVDEDGKVIEGPGQGEICYVNDYVRGYINLPEQTAATWRDGLFHTNDCARRDEDGNYYVVGRYDDMIKINGNRVEPVEIEKKIIALTGLKRVIAKGFKIDNRTFICAYFLTDEAKELGILKNGELVIDKDKLSESLPDYMIPTYYVGLDDFPLLPNGKIAKKNLVPPDTKDSVKEYVAPMTDTQKKICALFAQVLKLDKAGITDDFYAAGGDSMSSIVLSAKLTEAGLPISTKVIYEYRSPDKIAEYYDKNRDTLSAKGTLSDNSRVFEAPNYSGKAFLKSTKEGEGGLFTYSMTNPVDPDALFLAYERVVTSYPFFNYSYVERDNMPYYSDPGYIPKARPWKEFVKKDPAGAPLIEIFYEDEKIIINYFHLLTDGEGFFFFASTLLHEYINITQGEDDEQVARSFDYTYDCMAQKLDTKGEYRLYDRPETFKLPEYDPDNIKPRVFKLTLKRSNWKNIVDHFISDTDLPDIRKLRGIGGADAFVAGYLFLRAFAEVHPDAKLPLMCRFPINMRYALDKENTLRNCAMPQAFYNITSKDVLSGAMRPAYERVAEQISQENVAKEVNRLIEYLQDPDKDIGYDPVYNYIRCATTLATNLGNIASVRDAKHVRDFSISFRPTCCSSIQTCVKGDEQVLIINQLFEDGVYVKQLVEDLSSGGMIDIETSV